MDPDQTAFMILTSYFETLFGINISKMAVACFFLLDRFDSLRPSQQFLVTLGRVFLG